MFFKNHLISVTVFFISTLNYAQNTYIPDDNFEQALINLGYDVGPLNDYIPTANINTITDLDLSPFFNNKISNLKGIEGFIALTILNIDNHNIDSLNLNFNSNLKHLFCNNNVLTSLNISNNTALEILKCNNNLLTTLDLSNNSSLRALECSFNQIINLDVSSNTSLIDFVCKNNFITNIDISNNIALREFQCGDNQLSRLDVTNNTNLIYLYCENNVITNLDVTNNIALIDLYCFSNELSELNLSQNNALTSLICSENQLCYLNIKNGNNSDMNSIDFSSNPDLNCVIVDNKNNILSTWIPNTFLNYANYESGCSDFVLVDAINDFRGSSFTLPILSYGNYFTETGAKGLMLNAGDVVKTSQTIYIYNETSCNSNETSFNILITDEDFFIPRYFTPNNDGSHDLWKILDNTNTIESISIFNKYGKLIKYLSPFSEGWNGVFKGKLLQTDDYWYVIKITTGETLKGHFALKR